MATGTPDAVPTGPDLRGKRLLLVAPHPDDESLALGGLIQLAVRQGARVTLLQVTDGDNNPWPQRWLERRWRIGPRDRARWGARRVEEVHAALACLGLPTASLYRLGWPDLGTNQRLLGGGAVMAPDFIDAVRCAAPDIVVLPDLHDHHPDHGACHVLARVALARLALRPACLSYCVHGKCATAEPGCVVALDAGMRDVKRRAILAHRTQVALSRRRLLAKVGPEEPLHALQPPEYARNVGQPDAVGLPWRPSRCLFPWLRLSVVDAGGSRTWPWRHAPVRRSGCGWRLTLPDDLRHRPLFARLELRYGTPWIFDHWGWCDLTAVPSAGQAGK